MVCRLALGVSPYYIKPASEQGRWPMDIVGNANEVVMLNKVPNVSGLRSLIGLKDFLARSFALSPKC